MSRLSRSRSPHVLILFEAAVEHVNKNSYSSKQKLKLYGLYKHITVGRCNVKKPGRLKVSANAKYEAWKSCEGLSVTDAMEQYVNYLAKIDKMFKPDKIKVESDDEVKVLEDLE